MQGLAVQHLLLRLRPINRALRRAVERQRVIASELDRAELSSACITDEHVAILLDRADRDVGETSAESEADHSALMADENELETQYRATVVRNDAALPLDALRDRADLNPSELACALLCAAPEIHSAYEGIFAYVLDDVRRRHPCPELLCRVGAASVQDELALRPLVGPFGRLRRTGIIQTAVDEVDDARTRLRLAPGLLEFLLGAAPSVSGLWRQPDEVRRRSSLDGTNGTIAHRIEQLGTAIANGTVNVGGVWGHASCSPYEVAAEIARRTSRPLHHAPIDRCLDESPAAMRALRESVISAAVAGAILELATDDLHEFPRRALANWIAETLAACDVPVILVGHEPWRPTPLLSQRAYAEIVLESPNFNSRSAMWRSALPEVSATQLDDVAGRFHLSASEVHAAARVARTGATVSTNGTPIRVDDTLDEAIFTVARKTSGKFLCLVKPRRGPQDLILPPMLHRQVIEVAHFTRALPRVSESWGFARLATGGDGIKALFTGDPGTGKTLAAEVVAKLLGVPLLKVNLGQTVSKWLGETEKHLDEAFEEATSNHALLFFDEADALFGKRGELKYGVDRYANTEVSHLLQRLEAHNGLVILASNLKENIDPAFMRRFHVTIHFPRPTESDRRRIWRIAFPSKAPLDEQVDLGALSRLDLTGAGIVSAARTAAFLAVDEDAPAIDMSHIVRGISRQFRRESRVLKPAELGRFASLLQERE